MKKRLLTVLLTLIATLCLCFALVGCDFGGGSKSGSDNSGTNNSTTDSGSTTEQGGTGDTEQGGNGGTTKPDEGGTGSTTKPDEGQGGTGGITNEGGSQGGSTGQGSLGSGSEDTGHTHVWGEWIVTNAATCEEAGSQYRECNCGEIQKEEIPAKAHSYSDWIESKKQTCTEQGKQERICNICKKQEEKTIPALGHEMTFYEGTVTCTEAGVIPHFECSRCHKNFLDIEGLQELDKIDNNAIGHLTVLIEGNPATCYEDGIARHYFCLRCGLNFSDQEGSEPMDDDDIHLSGGHIPVHYEAKQPTCKTLGNIDYWGCDRCGKTFRDNTMQEEIENYLLETLPHSFQDKVCTVCGALEPSIGLEYMFYGDYYAMTGMGTCSDTFVVIPDIYGGFPVTEIRSSAFAYNTSITQIFIPNTIRLIGSQAFLDCTSLTAVHIDDVEAWCKICFSDSYANPLGYAGHLYVDYVEVTDLAISDDITSVENYAFYGCSELKTVTLGKNITSIGEYAFYNCSGLTSINIPQSVTSVGHSMLAGCINLESITLSVFPNIKHSAFQNRESIFHPFGTMFYNLSREDNVYGASPTYDRDGCYCVTLSKYDYADRKTLYGYYFIPESLKNVTFEGEAIPDHAFYNCKSLESVTIKNGVSKIGDEAFSGCSSLVDIAIPDGVTSIGDYTFYDCSGLTCIEIPDSVALIGYRAFRLCSGLKSVTIGSGVTSIGDGAFSWCSSLESMTIPFADGDCTRLSRIFQHSDNYTTTEDVPASLKEIVITGGISIGNGAFVGCSGLTSIKIPDSVTSIGNGAFGYCSGLMSIEIPESVTSIGSYAFQYCSGLTSIEVAQGNPVYHSAVNCLIDTDSKTLISACKTSIIPTDGSVTSIGESAFRGCSLLTEIEIPDSVTSIGDYAFSDCGGLTSVEIPDSVTSIGENAFWSCIGLKSVIISDSVTEIGDYAFWGCSGMTSIEIPDGVTSIGIYVFYGCSKLESVTFGSGVTEIGYWTLYGCSALTDIQFRGTVEEWDSITKDLFWNDSTGNYTITCTDGTINKNGNVTYFDE